ncbi:MAG: FAD-dependent oxidoreductase [Rickettsiales bacterium]
MHAMGTVHIIGAGVSGLAAAAMLAEKHVPVRLYEASSAAGGRARSSTIGALSECDHGLHIVDANARELFSYLDRVGARDALQPMTHPLPLPFAPVADYLELARYALRPTSTLDRAVSAESPLAGEWLAPFARNWLHSDAHQLPAPLAAQALRRLVQPAAWRMFHVPKLSRQLITPALDYLERHGGSLYFSHALKSLVLEQGAPHALQFARKKIALGDSDIVIFATPPAFAASVIPGLVVPSGTHAAIICHFAVAHGVSEKLVAAHDSPVDMIHYAPGRISCSIRVADNQWHEDGELLARRLWRFLQKRHDTLREQAFPDYALHREKRAGHALQPLPLPEAHLPPRVLLAGDWLDPTRPATLNAAAGSGHRAARAALALLGGNAQHAQRPPEHYAAP